MIDQIPPEICAHIFGFACRDSGYTGRSLSLVSRYIRETSELAKLQSIALFGRQQILAFAELLDRTPPHLRTTRYLFINGQESKEEMVEVTDVAYGGFCKAQAERDKLVNLQVGGERVKAGDERVKELDEEVDRQWSNAQQYMEEFGTIGAHAVESILRNLSPTLELLDLALNEYVANMMVNAVSLPHLVDLTTRCCFPLHPSANPVLEPSHFLRYLHVVEAADQREWTTQFFKNGISHFAPSLSHLRLSQQAGDYDVIPDLESALGPDPRTTLTQLPPTLELVLIEPAVPPPPYDGCSCCDDTPNYYELLKNARHFRDKGDHRVVLLQADPNHRDVYFQAWMDKAEGAACRWDTSSIDLTPAEGEVSS